MSHPDSSSAATHERVLDIFRRHLANPSLGPTDDFFEMGGDSFLAMEVIAEIDRMFAYELDLAVLIESKSIGAVVQQVETAILLQKEATSDV